MFLYPISRMTGGIYYEHAHRLFGALVGLATLAVAGRLWRVEPRSWVRALAAAAVVVVAVQGLLGGLRVTGRLTLSTAVEDMAPSIGLAILHGVLGQVFLALMVVVAAATSRRWKSAPAPEAAAHSARRSRHAGRMDGTAIGAPPGTGGHRRRAVGRVAPAGPAPGTLC